MQVGKTGMAQRKVYIYRMNITDKADMQERIREE